MQNLTRVYENGSVFVRATPGQTTVEIYTRMSDLQVKKLSKPRKAELLKEFGAYWRSIDDNKTRLFFLQLFIDDCVMTIYRQKSSDLFSGPSTEQVETKFGRNYADARKKKNVESEERIRSIKEARKDKSKYIGQDAAQIFQEQIGTITGPLTDSILNDLGVL